MADYLSPIDRYHHAVRQGDAAAAAASLLAAARLPAHRAEAHLLQAMEAARSQRWQPAFLHGALAAMGLGQRLEPAMLLAKAAGMQGRPDLAARLLEPVLAAGAAAKAPPATIPRVPVTEPRDCVVNVLIPVYAGLEQSLECIHSVLAHAKANRVAHHVIVLDDASPDEALVRELRALAQAARIEHVRREANLGFIRNMNLGMALHPWRDVVWLNSDTRVHGDWLDRLQAAATQSPDTASATPLSNHGELMSFPASRVQHAMPDPAAHAQLDILARGLADEAPPPLEMGCGFCMYIRRDALQAVGLLDETGLTRGYGEDSDWCLRARAAGWRHVAAPNVFVAHAGGVSFGAEKALRVRQNNAVLRRRYPDAEARFDLACVRDPVAPARQRLQRARLGLLREWIAAAAPCPAFAPGALRSPRRLHITGPAPTGDADDPVDGIELRFRNDGQASRVSLQAALPPLPLLLDYRLPRDAEQLLQDLRSLPLEGLVYGALRGCPPELRELPALLGLPYLVRCEDDALLEPGGADFAAGARFVELPWRAQLERYRRALRGARLRAATGMPAARSGEPGAVAPAAPLLIADALDRPAVCRRWLALARQLARTGSATRLLLDHPTPWEHELLATGVVMPVPKLSGVCAPDLLRLAGCGAAVSLDDAPGAGWTAPRIAQRGGLALYAPASAMAREAAAAPLALAGIDLDGLEPARTSVA